MPPRPESVDPAPLWAEHGWALSGWHAVGLVMVVAGASALVHAFGEGLVRLAGLG